jgi:hypothetical protein
LARNNQIKTRSRVLPYPGGNRKFPGGHNCQKSGLGWPKLFEQKKMPVACSFESFSAKLFWQFCTRGDDVAAFLVTFSKKVTGKRE